jgi:hypothetical protein
VGRAPACPRGTTRTGARRRDLRVRGGTPPLPLSSDPVATGPGARLGQPGDLDA